MGIYLFVLPTKPFISWGVSPPHPTPGAPEIKNPFQNIGLLLERKKNIRIYREGQNRPYISNKKNRIDRKIDLTFVSEYSATFWTKKKSALLKFIWSASRWLGQCLILFWTFVWFHNINRGWACPTYRYACPHPP